MKIAIKAFEARGGVSHEEQASECMDQLFEYISGMGYRIGNVISINLFLAAESNEVFDFHVKGIKQSLPDTVKERIPVACLAQAPADGNLVSAEVHFIPDLNGAQVITKIESGNKYLVIKNDSGEKLVIANGIGAGNHNHQVPRDSEQVFGIMERILHSEGMDFSNIFRQWNYIEDITFVEYEDRVSSQHYQVFNNVRSKYYARSDFRNGYPSATGIGTKAGGVIVSFYAANPNGYKIYSIENPLQRAAFNYTDEVLIGDAEYQGFIKCTPKFARAKLMQNKVSFQVYISGTASIREEKTIGENDVVRQTQITIENISKLINSDTLSSINKDLNAEPKIDFIRVYIKRPEDFSAVKSTCETMLPGIPGIFVVSDICREKLLVEIEALASAF